MKRFFSTNELGAEIVDAALFAGGKALDGDPKQLTGVMSVEFGEATVIFSIPKIHRDYSILIKTLEKHFLIFSTSKEIFFPFVKSNFEGEEVLRFFQEALARIKIGMCVGNIQEPTEHGSWIVPVNDLEPKSDPFDFLRVIEAINVGLLESMYGGRDYPGFELSLDTVRFRKKDVVKDIAPSIWVDQVLRDSETGLVFTRIKILSRSGKKYRVVSKAIPNSDVQDVKVLTEWVLSVTPSVVDRKSLGQFIPHLLRDAFNEFEARIWVRSEGWQRDDKSNIEVCAVGDKLFCAPNVASDKFFVDIVYPRLSQLGTLDSWNDMVLAPASKNPILTGALQLGLAASMVDFLPGISSCIFNFFGGAGRGKTLLLSTVASLYGNTAAPGQSTVGRVGKSMIETFGSTQRALQAKGQQLSLGPLLVDEIGSNRYGDLDTFVYEMGNGSNRTRLNSSGDVQESVPKTLFGMTSGEKPIISLITRNAPQGVLDRGVDINIGGGHVSFEGQDDEDFAFVPDAIKSAVSVGIQKQYGTVAPAFIKALLDEMTNQAWDGELKALVSDILEILPSYVARDGAKRVVVRFALSALAGKVALRNNVFSGKHVNEETLMHGVLVCTWLWYTTRWNHLQVLEGFLLSKSHIAIGSPKSRLDIYRHKDESDGMPTLMVSKYCLEEIFPGSGRVEIISSRLKEDGLLVRSDSGRNTVGKDPYYHLRTNWLVDHGVYWSEDDECFFKSDG
ncbi:DUF927 domain-containing protein [Pseudomonas sp. PDM32]|uniref:DUF927 domain-containing protein n=1 Tax=Pseudomonas sp. PDM32 TaxID=2854768 RepID=UPI001C49668E|nr:DUF927 domain-containing protein [Pseudomonas sp. PDM32]MBV7575925.1 DUF927 domain-containing protein [Pseudomonas sp. PDM32]